MQISNNKDTLYVVSCYTDKDASSPFTNRENHKELKRRLEDGCVDYIECQGSYNGKKEKSFIVKSEFVADWTLRNYDQECYLKLIPLRDGFYGAWLVFNGNGGDSFLGIFGSCAPVETPDKDYTYIPETDTWFKVYPSLREAMSL